MVFLPTPARSASLRWESPACWRSGASDGTGTPLVWLLTLLCLLPYIGLLHHIIAGTEVMWVWHYYVPTNFTLRHQLYPILKNAKNTCCLMRGRNGQCPLGQRESPSPSSSSAVGSILLLMGSNKPMPCTDSKSSKGSDKGRAVPTGKT